MEGGTVTQPGRYGSSKPLAPESRIRPSHARGFPSWPPLETLDTEAFASVENALHSTRKTDIDVPRTFT